MLIKDSYEKAVYVCVNICAFNSRLYVKAKEKDSKNISQPEVMESLHTSLNILQRLSRVLMRIYS